jgi:oxygen-independent coproporphyrinogen-3 oxidase
MEPTTSAHVPLYRFWTEYPKRDVEYVRWYPPTLHAIEPEVILDAIAQGSEDLAFYLHVPFCKDICPYCPFNKFRMRDERAAQFLDGIVREIAMVGAAQKRRGVPTTSGYFGGGTPTALETDQLLRIVGACFEHFPIRPGAEISIEANPDTVDGEKLRALWDVGIRRLSFGVQSFKEEFLSVLGRTHGVAGALASIERARRTGFQNIAIDLIYRVPGQTLDQWREDLQLAIDLGIEHISTYCLFLDPGTRLYNDTLAGRVADYPDEETEIAMYELTQEMLGEAGYHHYTINDFALPGRESEHHQINWKAPQRSYVGLGPGAFSYVDGADGSYIYCTQHGLGDYLASVEEGRLPVRLANRLDRTERMARYMVLGLRCLVVERAPFRRLFGVDMEEAFAEPIARLKEWGLVESDDRRLWMTDRGKHFASNVLKAFFTEPNYAKPQPIGVELFAGRGLSMVSVDFGSTGEGQAP